MYKCLVNKILIDDKEYTDIGTPLIVDSVSDLRALLIKIGQKEIAESFKIQTGYPNIIVLGDKIKIYISRIVPITTMIELSNIIRSMRSK
jgi:hypothetical protein